MSAAQHPAPKVSAVMPIYKPDFLPAAIESILAQTMREFELILVNDASPHQQTDEIARHYAAQDARIRYHPLPQNGGVAAARNFGVRQAVAPVIMWMDDDDISLPVRMREQYDVLQAHPQVAAVSCAYQIIKGGVLTAKVRRYHETLAIKAPSVTIDTHAVIVFGSMVKKEAFDQVGGFRRFFTSSEDVDLCLRMGEAYATAYVPSVLYQYRSKQEGVTLSGHPLAPIFHATAILSALTRRAGKPDIINDDTALDDVLPLLQRLPVEQRRRYIRKLASSIPAEFNEYRQYFPDDELHFSMQSFKQRIKRMAGWR